MQGIVFIPDISGFTNFVNKTNINLGASIISDLLNEIIEHNSLDLEISEIEGDAVLYYKAGSAIELKEILEAYKKIQDAFVARFASWKLQYDIQEELSLKLIIHYGDLMVYNVRGFLKLYGKTVVESHRLLKNGSPSGSYLLVTEDYLKALCCTRPNRFSGWHHRSCSARFADLRKMTYHFFTDVSVEADKTANFFKSNKREFVKAVA